jgi:AcrR family transcriptional regulator
MTIQPRARNARATANDAAIASAAVGEILRVGVDRVSLREVAQRAGLTHGATYARYEDVSELLIDLWRSKLCDSAVELLELCRRAVEEPGEPATRALLERVREPRPEDVAMVEILLVSRRMDILYEEMEVFIRKHIYLDESLTDDSRARFVRSLSLFGLAMASVFDGHYFNPDKSYLGVTEKVLATALRDGPTGFTPSDVVREEVARPDDRDDENLRARLVYATFVVVAKSGYHGATVSRIARRAECSPGAIYKLYRSKEELVLDSFRTIFGITKGSATSPRGADGLETLLGRDRPQQVGHRVNFAMETTIAAAHNDTLRAAVGAYLADPSGLVARFGEFDDAQKTRVGEFVHAKAALAHGTHWMSAVMATEAPNFDEFSECFQVALLNELSSTGI